MQEREVLRVGGNKIIPVNVRVIAATNRDLWQLVKEGRFREDLYYRINVLHLYIPPLREHKEDIESIVWSLFEKFYSTVPVDLRELFPQLMKVFKNYSWPGNVRELENITERFLVLYKHFNINKTNLKDFLWEKVFVRQKDKQEDVTGDFPLKLEKMVAKQEKRVICKAIKEANGNKAKAAELLGISRTTLWRKIKELELNV